ncbi:hypothetical protein [Rhodococcus phenolicus]|uniref:hypothetical protein n=1 Tax=Rhodococcus phenolicus TaxID=263849 RepID=UPI0008353E07|nr:hypothetical protein [Rhodococcus phenolicus]
MDQDVSKARTLEMLALAGLTIPDDEVPYLVEAFEQSRFHADRVRSMAQTRYEEPTVVLRVGTVTA